MAAALRAKNRYAVPWVGEAVTHRASAIGPAPPTTPVDPMAYRGDNRTEGEKAEAYSRELKRRRGSNRNWFKTE